MKTTTNSRVGRAGWLAVAASLWLAMPARAQEPAPATSPGLKIESTEQVPDKRKLSEATQVLARLQGILKDVLKSLEEARAEKDVLKLNCVNEKLTQIKGLLRVVEQSDIALQEAVAKGDEESAQHEYAKITIARERAEQLRADADFLDDLAKTEAERIAPGNSELPLDALAALPGAIRTRVLRQAAIAAGCPAGSLTAGHVAGLDALVTGWRGQRWIDLPGGIRGQRRYGKLLLVGSNREGAGGRE